MNQMGNLEKLGILVIVILVVVVGVVVITPKDTLFPDDPNADVAELVPIDPAVEPVAPPDVEVPGAMTPPALPPVDDPSRTTVDPLNPVAPIAPPTPVVPDVRTVPTLRTVTVQKGDTLGGIAKRELGNAQLWPEIVKVNPTVDPKRLKLGTILTLPNLGSAAKSPEIAPVPVANVPAPGGGVAPPVQTPVVVPAVLPPPAAAADRIYLVQSGDTLSDIARRELGSASKYRVIADANQDTLKGSDVLRAGMKLRIPGASATVAPPSPVSPGGGSGATTYVVKSGDTLSSIASRMLGSSKRWREIQEANAAVLHGGTDLRIGMTLTIPTDVAAR